MVDPNPQMNQLDLKLKEAYDRVMGSGATPVGPTTPPSPIQSEPVSPVVPTIPSITPTPITPSPQMPMQTAVVEPIMPQMGAMRPRAGANPTASQTVHVGGPMLSPTATNPKTHAFVQPGKKGLGISPVIIVLGAIVFLLVYTFFWVKFFGVKLPFFP